MALARSRMDRVCKAHTSLGYRIIRNPLIAYTENVGAAPRGCPRTGRLQRIAPTLRSHFSRVSDYSITRMVCRSETKIRPVLSRTIEYGAESPVFSTGPALKLVLPLPAKVVTLPWGSMRRIRRLCVSATSRSPLGMERTPLGPKNEALAAGPSRHVPLPSPAKVMTLPWGSIFRTR